MYVMRCYVMLCAYGMALMYVGLVCTTVMDIVYVCANRWYVVCVCMYVLMYARVWYV